MLNKIKKVYTLHFTCRLPCFEGPGGAGALDGDTFTSCQTCNRGGTPKLKQTRFYSRYFLVPKKDGGLCPIPDLRPLNHILPNNSFRIATVKQILTYVQLGEWYILVDLKDAYFHIQIAPHHRCILRFAFDGMAYQFKVLPFRLALGPRTFTNFECSVFFPSAVYI